ncbi:hypothetical protein DFH11DRAFT_1584170 [Phellopilus nigrolimitatus]|nr:hypothetical protein DFH11DRAFT_1584170 [Phellopilus nigrolimitatus]
MWLVGTTNNLPLRAKPAEHEHSGLEAHFSCRTQNTMESRWSQTTRDCKTETHIQAKVSRNMRMAALVTRFHVIKRHLEKTLKPSHNSKYVFSSCAKFKIRVSKCSASSLEEAISSFFLREDKSSKTVSQTSMNFNSIPSIREILSLQVVNSSAIKLLTFSRSDLRRTISSSLLRRIRFSFSLCRKDSPPDTHIETAKGAKLLDTSNLEDDPEILGLRQVTLELYEDAMLPEMRLAVVGGVMPERAPIFPL